MGFFSKDKKINDKKTTDKVAPKSSSMKDMYADSPRGEASAPAMPTGRQAAKKSDKSLSKSAAVSRAYRVLLKPIVSEKASRQQSSNNQYFFAVAISANKIEVAKAIKSVYGVAPIKVNMIRVEGKARRYGRTIGKRKDWKKAVVTLAKGKTIALHEGV